jgi:muramoyltetrapeptide carboxypeptidase
MAKGPRKLPADAHIRVIAPASPAKDWAPLPHVLAQFQAFGFTVSMGKHIRKKQSYLAGSDRERLQDLHDAFRDPTVDAILALRGGYGTARLLQQVDYGLIKKNPKPIIGFSDVTALQLAIYAKTGVGSYSGPNFFGMIPAKTKSLYSFHHFLRAVLPAVEPVDLFSQSKQKIRKAIVVRPGHATGTLIGGNLSLLCSLLGTPYMPRLNGSILLLEEINEPPYRFDRLLTQLLNAGALRGVRAILFGECRDCDAWQSIAIERLKPLGVPMALNLPFGHIDELATFPIGSSATVRIGKQISLTL